jgi:hypothetical protein
MGPNFAHFFILALPSTKSICQRLLLVHLPHPPTPVKRFPPRYGLVGLSTIYRRMDQVIIFYRYHALLSPHTDLYFIPQQPKHSVLQCS